MSAVCLAVLAAAPCASAAFNGHNGRVAFELTGWDLSGTQFDNPPSANGEIAAMWPGTHPHAVLSCSPSIDAGCEAADPNDTGACTSRPGSPCLDDSRPSFAPDGKQIVFSDDPCTQRYCRRITLINADGTGETELPALTADDADPAFLATGALVFAGRAPRGGIQNLYTVSAEGTGLHQLTRGGGSEPAPCANGAIAFVLERDLYLLDAHRRLRLLAHGASWPDCSPNNRQIVFLHDQDLYLISSTGAGLRRLTYHRVAAAAPAFSPDGRLVALNTDHKPSKYWPPENTDGYCSNGVCTGIFSNVYLQIIDLTGHERGKPVYLGNSGSDVDGFANATDAGGISWQPQPDLATRVTLHGYHAATSH